MIIQLALGLSLALGGPDSTARTDTARSLTVPPWSEAAVSANTEFFKSRLSAWQYEAIALRYRSKSASHSIEAFTISRFDVRDAGLVLEESRELGRGAYLAGRLQLAPGASITARSDASLNLYQAIGEGWELVPAFRLMSYTDQRVRVLGMGAGRYVGLWFAGARVSQAHEDGQNAYTTSLQLRRYEADASPNFLDATVSRGREVVVRGPSSVSLDKTSSFAIRGQRLVSRSVGFSLGFTYDRLESLPDRRGVSVSTFLRW